MLRPVCKKENAFLSPTTEEQLVHGISQRPVGQRLTKQSPSKTHYSLIPLRRHNLVVERAQLHSETGPGVEMVCGGDSPTRALELAHGPVLIEGRRSLDGGLIGARVGVDVVGGAVGGDAAFVCGAGRGIVGPEGLHDVVLDEGREVVQP